MLLVINELEKKKKEKAQVTKRGHGKKYETEEKNIDSERGKGTR